MILPTVDPEDVTLNSKINAEQVVTPHVRVNFTCITRGSDILEWLSDEYIGPGGDRLQILSGSSRNSATSNSNPDTVATRISVTTENGEVVIVSILSIVVSAQYPTATITCSNSDRGMKQNITFKLTKGRKKLMLMANLKIIIMITRWR